MVAEASAQARRPVAAPTANETLAWTRAIPNNPAEAPRSPVAETPSRAPKGRASAHRETVKTAVSPPSMATTARKRWATTADRVTGLARSSSRVPSCSVPAMALAPAPIPNTRSTTGIRLEKSRPWR